ncbi:hypothetical protein KEM56_005411, partial [Ascosphaera pollenicola]
MNIRTHGQATQVLTSLELSHRPFSNVSGRLAPELSPIEAESPAKSIQPAWPAGMADPRLVAFRVQAQRKLVSSLPLHVDCLPLHDNLASTAHALERPTLQSFLQTVLSEGMDFIHDTVPKFPRSKTVNVSGPAKTEVLISKAVLDVQKRPFPSTAPQDGEVPHDEEAEMQNIQESWIVRKSFHPNLPLTGTASWDEFCAWAHTQYILNAKLFLNH